MNTTLWSFELQSFCWGMLAGAAVMFAGLMWARPKPTHCASCRVAIAAERRLRRP